MTRLQPDLDRTIVFDGAVLAAGPVTGVAGSLLTTLRSYAAHHAGRCVLLVPAGTAAPDVPGVEIVAGPRGAIARQRDLPRVLRALDADLLHCPVAAVPWSAPCPTVATVHDVPWRASVRLREEGSSWRHRLALRIAAQRSAAVITPTAAVACDVEAAVPGCRAAVHVVPHGVVAPPSPAPPEDLCGPLLVIADDRPRKNLGAVRAAHRRAGDRVPPLRIIGTGHGDGGYLPEPDKIAALRRARALLVLSLHEGFGLPVLEAFAHGVPVLCSDIPALREVAGGSALRVDPRNEGAMAGAMVAIHRDEALRARLRAAGLARARAFTPEASAEGWRRVHDQVLVARAARCTS